MSVAGDALLDCLKKHGSPMNMRDLLLARFHPGMQPEWLNNLLREMVSQEVVVRSKDPETGFLVFSVKAQEAKKGSVV